MLSESEAGNFLRLWASELGFDELRPADILARASPVFRALLSGFLGSPLQPYPLSLFLSGFPCADFGGWRLGCRVDRGRMVWRIYEADSGGAPARETVVPIPSFSPDATPADLLALNLCRSLHRQAELLNLDIDPADPKTARLVADVANHTLNAALRAQENSLIAKRDTARTASPKLMERVAEARRILAERRGGDDASRRPCR